MNLFKRVALYLFYFFILSYFLGLGITGFFLIIIALLDISEEVRELNKKLDEMKKDK